jgi:hypothetical protein
VAERLTRLRQQRDALRAISFRRPTDKVTASDVLQALDDIGRLMGTMEDFTWENRRPCTGRPTCESPTTRPSERSTWL